MNIYLLFKSLHLIDVISWMAGLLYLPRIFVYHVEASKNENQNSTFKIMERKLYFYIWAKNLSRKQTKQQAISYLTSSSCYGYFYLFCTHHASFAYDQ